MLALQPIKGSRLESPARCADQASGWRSSRDVGRSRNSNAHGKPPRAANSAPRGLKFSWLTGPPT